MLRSGRNPLCPFSQREQDKKRVDTLLKTKRGFLSPSINTLNFGLLESKQWAGEERLLKNDDQPFEYSIIANTFVKAYEISKFDARKKLPTELMMFLVKLVEQRYKWIEQRTRYLVEKSRAVATMDPSNEKYDENLLETSKRYPAASSYVINNIRKKYFLLRAQQRDQLISPASCPAPGANSSATMATPGLSQTYYNVSPSKPDRNAGETFSSVMGMTVGSPFHALTPALGKTTPLPKTLPLKKKPLSALRASVESVANRSSLVNLRNANYSVETIYSPKGSSLAFNRPMNVAASTPKLLNELKMVPKFGRNMKPSRNVGLGMLRVSSMMAMTAREKPVESMQMPSNLSQFSVGCRTIMLLSQIHGNRPPTPNATYTMSSRAEPGQLQS